MSATNLQRKRVLARLGLPYRSPYDADFFAYAPFQKRLRRSAPRAPSTRTAYGLVKGVNRYPRVPTTLSLRFGSYMPDQLITNIRFAAMYADTSAGGALDLVIRGNSPYDPYVSVGGEEGAGWDELAAIYTKYKVLASSIKLTIVNLDSDDPVFTGIFPSVNSSSATTVDAQSQAYGKTAPPATLNGGHTTVSNYMATRCLLSGAYNDSDVTALVSADPTTQWYWHCLFKNISGNALNLNYKVELNYRVMFFSRTYAHQQ